MKFLATIPSENIDEIEERFRTAGIPVYLEPDYSRGLRFVTGGASAYSNAGRDVSAFRVHVCLISQFDEAEHLLENPDYKVQFPVDIEEFEAAIEKAKSQEDVEGAAGPKGPNRVAASVVLLCAVALIALAAIVAR